MPFGDYHHLNVVTQPDRYPIPQVHDFTFQLAVCTFFSKINLVWGYHQVPVAGCVQDGHDHPVWAVGIHQDAAWLEKCQTNLPQTDWTLFFKSCPSSLSTWMASWLPAWTRTPIFGMSVLSYNFLKRLALSSSLTSAPLPSTNSSSSGTWSGHAASTSYPAILCNFLWLSTEKDLRWFLGAVIYFHDFIPHAPSSPASSSDHKWVQKIFDWLDGWVHPGMERGKWLTQLFDTPAHPVADTPLALKTDTHDHWVGTIVLP